MPVDQPNKEYNKSVYKIKVVRDCCAGSEAIKSAQAIDQNDESPVANMAGTFYLPAPNPDDSSKENRLRYIDYKKRALFVNFTGHTKDAYVGMVCRKEPSIVLPKSLLPMQYNVDGMGNSVYTSIKRTLDEVVTVAREGLLLDYAKVAEGQNLSQTEGVMPTIKPYVAESIINWKTEVINGLEALTMVVLKEEIAKKEDEFTDDVETQYRVLRMVEGVYTQEIYTDNDELIVWDEEGNTSHTPKQADGKPWDFIPFIFCGALNNDPDIDRPVLYDLAEINISHYRNSADYEDSCFMVGQPTPVMAGLTQHWVDEVLKGQVVLGSRAFVGLPVGGSAMLLQANPNQMPEQGMKTKENQMIQIGAKIITSSGGVETAEAARIRFSGQNSKLGTLVDNVEQAYEQMFEWALLFIGGKIEQEEEITISLNKEFYEQGADPQMIPAQILMLDRQIISTGDIRNYLRTSGNIDGDRSDEDIEADLKEVNPIR